MNLDGTALTVTQIKHVLKWTEGLYAPASTLENLVKNSGGIKTTSALCSSIFVGISLVHLVAMASPGRQGAAGGGSSGGALSTRGGSGARRMKWALELSLGNTR